jgi:hypothetical protein
MDNDAALCKSLLLLLLLLGLITHMWLYCYTGT